MRFNLKGVIITVCWKLVKEKMRSRVYDLFLKFWNWMDKEAKERKNGDLE
jgi:hypothetical protein